MNRYLIPAFAFVLLAAVLAWGLTLNPREIPSPLVGKPAPAFSLPSLEAVDAAAETARDAISPADFVGQVWVLNVWASWCAACLDEHENLMALARTQSAPIIGLNYKDAADDARAWLEKWGNPYAVSAYDEAGQAGFDWGVYGVPETFVIDTAGVIRYKHIGPLTRADITSIILPHIGKLQAEAVQ